VGGGDDQLEPAAKKEDFAPSAEMGPASAYSQGRILSTYALFGAIESGLLFSLVAFAIYLSFRVLNFPDVTVDGSFPLGGAVAAILIDGGFDPYLATLIAIAAGVLAGAVTAGLNVFLNILHLFAGILTMIALYSINLRIMGRPNVSLLNMPTVFTPLKALGLPSYVVIPVVFAVIALAVKLLLNRFLGSRMGLAMRATGANAQMATAQGIDNKAMIILGIAVANGLVALAGALFAQNQGSADVTMGVGLIMIGLASLIAGESVLRPRTVLLATIGCVVGSVLYRIAVALALNADFLGLRAQDLNMVTAAIVILAIVFSDHRGRTRLRVR
jgi:putative tryptophan/tyrosine transport system permease protein